MERLSGLDASFLYLETPEQAMDLNCIVEIDPSTIPGGYDYQHIRAELARRIAAMPAFRRKLADSAFNVDHPVWVEDDAFDVDNHLHLIAVPAPGGITELGDLCASLAGRTLDRRRPLWELWLIEGLADQKMAALLRMHHANADGVTGAAMLAQLCTLTPEAPQLDPNAVTHSAGGTSRAGLAVSGALHFAQRPLVAAKVLPRSVQAAAGWVRRRRVDDGMPAPFEAPRTRFNGPISTRRTIGITQLSLGDVKRVKNQFGVTVNDVVLAITSGALRTYLLEHEELPDRPLIGLVPVSVHDGDEADLVVSGTNKVTGMFTVLPTDVDSAVGRVRRVAELSRSAKDHHAEIDPNMLRLWAQLGSGSAMSPLMRLYGDRGLASAHPAIFTATVTNVPGPDFPVYFLGARVTGMFPFGPIFHGLGLTVSVFSADGHLNVGVLACPDQVPDVWELAHAVDEEMKQLLDACDEP